MADAALQRKNMVESQVRPSDVTDRRITAAMMSVPREHFVPAALAPLAYMDEAIEIGPGQTLMAPRDFARLAQLAAIEPTDKVLVIGGASGYAAAVLANLAGSVMAVDAGDPAHRLAVAAVAALAIRNMKLNSASLAGGWPSGAPYDVIFIEGAIDLVPEALTDQLAAGGRLVAVQNCNGVANALLIKKANSGLVHRLGFEAAAPRLSGFEQVGSRFAF